MCTSIWQFKLTNTIINNHDYSVYIVNLYTVSTDGPVIMFIFLIYYLVLCWGNVSNSEVTMKFAQLHYFLSQNIGGDKRYYVPSVPPMNLVPGTKYNFACNLCHDADRCARF